MTSKTTTTIDAYDDARAAHRAALEAYNHVTACDTPLRSQRELERFHDFETADAPARAAYAAAVDAYDDSALSFFWACFTDAPARTFENQDRCLVAVYHSFGESAMMWVEARVNDGKDA